jgi:hypothetical protein
MNDLGFRNASSVYFKNIAQVKPLKTQRIFPPITIDPQSYFSGGKVGGVPHP